VATVSIFDFLARCQPLSDGFAALEAGDIWRLGSVLYARAGASTALVQKASVYGEAYQFAGLWALPGGMVRAETGYNGNHHGCFDLIRQSLVSRAALECGLQLSDMIDLGTTDRLGPIVTSYTAKERQRFTLMTVQRCRVGTAVCLSSKDRSIASAEWHEPPLEWGQLAPGNRLALAHLLWAELSETQRTTARRAVEFALEQCADWAKTAGVVAPPSPWADGTAIARWRTAWPYSFNEPDLPCD